jgi:hypothetical protein
VKFHVRPPPPSKNLGDASFKNFSLTRTGRQFIPSLSEGVFSPISYKINKDTIVLHSFAHLSSSKSSPEFAMEVFALVKEKLENRGITVHITPFGYFYEFSIHVRGESLAKVFTRYEKDGLTSIYFDLTN